MGVHVARVAEANEVSEYIGLYVGGTFPEWPDMVNIQGLAEANGRDTTTPTDPVPIPCALTLDGPRGAIVLNPSTSAPKVGHIHPSKPSYVMFPVEKDPIPLVCFNPVGWHAKGGPTPATTNGLNPASHKYQLPFSLAFNGLALLVSLKVGAPSALPCTFGGAGRVTQRITVRDREPLSTDGASFGVALLHTFARIATGARAIISLRCKWGTTDEAYFIGKAFDNIHAMSIS